MRVKKGRGQSEVIKWLFSGVIFVTGMAADCTHMLVRNAQHHCKKSGASNLNYSEVVHNSFLFSSYSVLNKYASSAKVITDVLISTNELGFLCIYAMFYTQNIQQVDIPITEVHILHPIS